MLKFVYDFLSIGLNSYLVLAIFCGVIIKIITNKLITYQLNRKLIYLSGGRSE